MAAELDKYTTKICYRNYSLASEIVYALFYLFMFFVMVGAVFRNASTKQMIANRHPIAIQLIVFILCLFACFVVSLIDLLVIGKDTHSVIHTIMSSLDKLFQLIPSLLFFNMMFRLKVVFITLDQKNHTIKKQLYKIQGLQKRSKIALFAFIITWTTSMIICSILTEIFRDNRRALVTISIFQICLFVPYRFGYIYLITYFWRIGYFVSGTLRQQQPESYSNVSKFLLFIYFI